MKTKNKKSGFTLVELMIVAAIIAILAAIIIPLLTANRDRAVAADGQNLLGTAATALKVYYAKTGTTPTMALVEADDPLLADQLSKSKYFNAPTLSTAVGTAGNTFTYTLQATIKSAVGSFKAADPLTLNDTGIWGGTVATTANL